MAKTSSSRFIQWVEFLDLDANGFHREDFFLAQIACEIRRMFSKNPESIKLEDFLLKFESNEKPKEEEPAVDSETRLALSKAFWLALAGTANTG